MGYDASQWVWETSKPPLCAEIDRLKAENGRLKKENAIVLAYNNSLIERIIKEIGGEK